MDKGRMRIYLSGPITGALDYQRKFNLAEIRLKDAGYSVVNPAKCNCSLPVDTKHEEFMHVCFAQMDLCDAVYMLKGWDKSNGCRQEFEYASRNGMTITFEGGTVDGKQTSKSV